MRWLFEKNNMLRLTGILAIVGMATILFVDIKLLYMPLSLKEYATFRAAMTRSREEINLYSKIAVLCIPFILLGLFHFYISTLKTHRLLAWVITLVYAFGYINAAFYYAFLGYVMNLAQLLVPMKLKLPYFTEHIYFIFQMQYFGSIIAGSLLFFLSLSFFKHNYPKRYIYINPLYLIGIFRFLMPMAASPAVTGFLLTSVFNGIMLVTMILSTIILWNKPVQDILPEKWETRPAAS